MSEKEKLSTKKAEENIDEFAIAQFKLNSIQKTYTKLPYVIDEIDILNYAEKELINKKALAIAMRKSGIEFKDPISYIKELEMLELLVNYLQNDPVVKAFKEKYEDKDDTKKDSYSLK